MGHILCTEMTIETASGPVRPERQRQGIGSALMDGGLEACRHRGHTASFGVAFMAMGSSLTVAPRR